MRQQAQNWLQDGLNDLADARKMSDNGMYNWSVFAARQAAEKALKGAYIALRQEDPPSVHSLIGLGRQIALSIPEDLEDDLRELSRHYTTTRYPDAVEGLTSEAYSLTSAQRAFDQAERIIEWVTKGLLSKS